MLNFPATHRIVTASTLILLACIPAALPAQGMDWQWVRGLTGSGHARSVAVDASGGIYLAGSFSGELTIDTVALTSVGSSDIFVLKFNPDGAVIWGRSFGADWLEYCREVAVDDNGDIFIAAEFTSNVLTIGPYVLVNNYQAGHIQSSTFDVLVMKMSGDGDVLWARSGGGLANEAVGNLSADTSGNVLVLGEFFSPQITFDALALTHTNPGTSDLYLLKYDGVSNPIWLEGAVGDEQDDAWAVATDSADQIYIGGAFRSSSLTFDGITLPNSSDSFELYLAKLDPDGETLWAMTAAGESWDEISAIAVDSMDDVYCTGHFRSDSLCFATETIYLSPYEVTNIDMFVAKLDGAGAFDWITSSTGGALVYPVAIDAWDTSDVAITGTFNGRAEGFPENFDAHRITPVGSYDIFTVQYDAAGNALWSEALGGEMMEFSQDVAHDPSGSLYLTAWFESDSLRVGSTLLINDQYSVSFLGKKTRAAAAIASAAVVPPPGLVLGSYPNPFAGTATIFYDAGTTRPVTLRIYNVAGRLVRTLGGGPGAGRRRLIWDGRGGDGNRVPRGVYLLQLDAEPGRPAQKVVVIE